MLAHATPAILHTHAYAISAAPTAGAPRVMEAEQGGQKEDDAGEEDATDFIAGHGGPRED